jgi:hypothetical protein
VVGRVTLPTDVAEFHAQGWQPWEIAEATGRSTDEVHKLLADHDAECATSATSATSGPPPRVTAHLALSAQRQDAGEPRLTLDPAASHGLAGRVVATLGPHTEADDGALLLTFLAAFGNAVGPGPRALVGAAEHPPRLNVLLVGETARARKGTAQAEVNKLVALAEPGWFAERVMGGLASGEGLIATVRDPATDDDTDAPVDKRLLVVEPEFARVLAVAAREGNTLSTVLRQAWDDGRLRNMTRKDPLRASGAHISIVGHITAEELLRRLSDTEVASGFANRFLLALVKRSKKLPEGGTLDPAALDDLAADTIEALTAARRVGIVRRSEAARELWAKAYEEFGDGGGLAGALTARAEAQTLRLSVCYALLDGSPVVEPAHLEAALAVWSYCEASAYAIFGDALGDPIADRLLEALRQAGDDGLDTTAQSALFGRHVSADRRAQALALLEGKGLIVTETEETGGRPRLVSRAAKR